MNNGLFSLYVQLEQFEMASNGNISHCDTTNSGILL